MNKHLVLVLQDQLLNHLKQDFSFDHIREVRDEDKMRFHVYELRKEAKAYFLSLKEILSTDSDGITNCLKRRDSSEVELGTILERIEKKLPKSAPLTVGDTASLPVPKSLDLAADDNS